MTALSEAIALRHQLYYGLSEDEQPELCEAANQLGALLPQIAAEALTEYQDWVEQRILNPPDSSIDTYLKEVLAA